MYETTECESRNQQCELLLEEKEPEPTIEEVLWAIKNLKNGKSAGCDEITAELIKTGGKECATVYHALCKRIWHSGIWPKEWKRTVFIPLPNT